MNIPAICIPGKGSKKGIRDGSGSGSRSVTESANREEIIERG